MSSDSEKEIKSPLPKKIQKKIPKSLSAELLKQEPDEKKLSTRDMLHNALKDLHTRKGVSLHAVRKFIKEKYSVNPDKINYLIKNTIKSDLEKGSIVQTKGVGVTGSFKLAPQPKNKINKPKKETSDKSQENVKELDKAKTKKTGTTKTIAKKVEKDPEKKVVMAKSSKTENKKEKTVKEPKAVKTKGEKKMAKEKQTPAKKKKAMMRKKSIGSIIKPPKMKPEAN